MLARHLRHSTSAVFVEYFQDRVFELFAQAGL
jgi:hypothetical protein